jgi:hypothetical protein
VYGAKSDWFDDYGIENKKKWKKKKKNGQNSGKKSYIFDLNRATLLSNISPG